MKKREVVKVAIYPNTENDVTCGWFWQASFLHVDMHPSHPLENKRNAVEDWVCFAKSVGIKRWEVVK